jgi:hypothetical protein
MPGGWFRKTDVHGHLSPDQNLEWELMLISREKLSGVSGSLVLLVALAFWDPGVVMAYEPAGSDYDRALDPALGIGAQFGRWDGLITLVYDPDGAPDIFFNSDDVVALLEEAVGEWELVSGIRFQVSGVDSNAVNDDNAHPDDLDGLVRVFWGTAGGAAGRAGPDADFYSQDKGFYPFIDGSVELNQDESLWNYKSELVGVLVHELGHLIGLGHSDNPDSAMYANPYNHLNHPRADDILAVRALYGNGTLDLADVTQPVSRWVYQPLPAAPASRVEFLFKANQFADSGAFISVNSDTPVTNITNATTSSGFVRFNPGGIGNFSNTQAISIDATVVYVDPMGYRYDQTDMTLSCSARSACDGGWVSIGSSAAMKTIPGDWMVYVEDDENGTNLLELPFTVSATTDYNKPPIAEVTVDPVSGTNGLGVKVSLLVTDPEGHDIDVIWHPHGDLGDQDGDGFLDTEVRDSAASGDLVQRNISFLSVDSHTLFVELVDDQARYDGSQSESSVAGRGFQNLIAITVNLPLINDDDVTIVSSFGEVTTGSNGESPNNANSSQVISQIASAATLNQITASDGTATTAGFGAGASADGGSTTATEFSAGQNITIAGSVTPQAGDVGKAGEIFVVLYTSTSLSYMDVDGNYRQWGGSLKTIQPALERTSLGSQETIEVFSDTVQSGLYRIFLGYRLTEGGPIHFNAKAFRINVN